MRKIQDILFNKLETKSLYEILALQPTIGDRLKYLRKTHFNKTRAKMAKEIDLEPTTIQKYEENRTTPKISRLKEFADYFGVPVEVLTGEESTSLIMEDYFLIGNLKHFCWRIEYDRNLVLKEDIYKEIKIAIYKANIIVVENISENLDLLYIGKLFDLDSPTNQILIDVFNEKIKALESGTSKSDAKNTDVTSRVFDYAINTKNLINKVTYHDILNALSPLVECYKKHPE